MIKNGLLLYFNILIFVKLEQEIETLMRLQSDKKEELKVRTERDSRAVDKDFKVNRVTKNMTRAQQLSQHFMNAAKFGALTGFRNNYFRNTLNSFLKLNAQFKRKVYKRTINVNARFTHMPKLYGFVTCL